MGRKADRMIIIIGLILLGCEIINKVAPTEARVLITGPNGTGKEVVAHLIHENSARANGFYSFGEFGEQLNSSLDFFISFEVLNDILSSSVLCEIYDRTVVTMPKDF